MGLYFTETLKRPADAIPLHWQANALGATDVWSPFGLGRAYRALGIPDSATKYFRMQSAWSRNEGNAWGEAYAQANLGQICHRDLRPRDLLCAIGRYDSALAAVNIALPSVGGDDNRAQAAGFVWQLYDDMVLALLAADSLASPGVAKRLALFASDVARSPSLLQLAREGVGMITEGGIGRDSVPEAWRALRHGSSSTYSLSYFVGKDTLVGWLALPGERVSVFRRAVTDDSVYALVAALRRELGVAGDFSGTRMRGRSRPQTALATQDLPRESKAFLAARDLLLPPELEELVPAGADLVIIPHSFLDLVPFAALPLVGDAAGDLGARYPLRFAPSHAILRVLESRQRARAKATSIGKALVIGNPRMPSLDLGLALDGISDGPTMLSELPASEVEARWIAERLGVSSLTGARATETTIRSRMQSADIVHLATHALVTEYTSFSRQSFLATTADSKNDGRLTAGELLDLPQGSLSARLVVLSVCQTAIGPIRYSEGSMGLQRAFLARGAEAVLASQWSVNDESTSLLMRRFYDHWLSDTDKPTKAESLRRAQADVRNTKGFEHPIYWAGFQLIGIN